MQVASGGKQLPGDWPWAPSYLPSMSAVALLPEWGKVDSGLYRSQGTGASVYLATVEPLLDTLGGEASWVPLGHAVYRWPCQCCCQWTLVTTHYYWVAACLWSYHALVFGWLVGIGCFACRSGLVHLCWYVCTCGITHALDPLLYQVPGIALMSWSVCYMQVHWAYLLVVFYCVYTASCGPNQPLDSARPWSCQWLACGFAAAQFVQRSPCNSELTKYCCSCEGQGWYIALLFRASLWFKSCLVCFLGSKTFVSLVFVWVDVWVVTWPGPSCGLRVLVYCCLHWGPWPHFCCT